MCGFSSHLVSSGLIEAISKTHSVKQLSYIPSEIQIAGLSIPLTNCDAALSELRATYEEFDERTNAFKEDVRNPHLCEAGCSHCCKQGAIFAVTLAEAVEWAIAIQALPTNVLQQAREMARNLMLAQNRIFGDIEGPPDRPGLRDEATFSKRISALNALERPACPLLFDDLCGVYERRPMLCRAYGFPVDAYAVRTDDAIVFRSLCVLYEGKQLVDYVCTDELKSKLAEISKRLGGGKDWGRFTSVEVVLASLRD